MMGLKEPFLLVSFWKCFVTSGSERRGLVLFEPFCLARAFNDLGITRAFVGEGYLFFFPTRAFPFLLGRGRERGFTSASSPPLLGFRSKSVWMFIPFRCLLIYLSIYIFPFRSCFSELDPDVGRVHPSRDIVHLR